MKRIVRVLFYILRRIYDVRACTSNYKFNRIQVRMVNTLMPVMPIYLLLTYLAACFMKMKLSTADFVHLFIPSSFNYICLCFFQI